MINPEVFASQKLQSNHSLEAVLDKAQIRHFALWLDFMNIKSRHLILIYVFMNYCVYFYKFAFDFVTKIRYITIDG